MLPPSNLFIPVVASAHETCPGRSAGGALAIGIPEERPLLRQLIDVGRLGDLVAIAPQGIRLEIIGNDQQDVFDFGLSRKTQNNKDGKNRPLH